MSQSKCSPPNVPVARPGDGIQVASDFGINNQLFGNVLRVRSHHGDEAQTFAFDNYSTHYVMSKESIAFASLTATRHRDGTMDCEHQYPSVLVDRYGDEVMTLCKSRVANSPLPGFQAFRRIIRSAWEHQLTYGIRMDLINVTKQNERIFRRIGYQTIEHCRFVHPTIGTDSVAMFLAADASRESFCRDLFEAIDTPLSHCEVLSAITSSEVNK